MGARQEPGNAKCKDIVSSKGLHQLDGIERKEQ